MRARAQNTTKQFQAKFYIERQGLDFIFSKKRIYSRSRILGELRNKCGTQYLVFVLCCPNSQLCIGIIAAPRNLRNFTAHVSTLTK